MPGYYIWTVGCQMNKAESERIGSYLEQLGYQPRESAGEADLVVVNSCVVRQSAESRVVHKLDALRSLKNSCREVTVAVTGCLVDSNVDLLRQSFPHVDHFFKPGELPRWVAPQGTETVPALPRHPSASTFVPIIQGCNNFCSYCIVPYRRDREKSRPMAEVVCEVNELVRRGVKEVILLGQNVDSYGHDLPGSPDLADLLAELDGTDGLARVRFLTSHPKDMSLKLIEAVARLGKVCEDISLPVQSGDDEILKAMRRGYTVEHYRQLIAGIRRRIPGIALSTDVIVGFPAETEQQFEGTVSLLSELRFDTVHVAAYSPRPGTFAAREFRDDVPRAVKRERLNRIEQLQKKVVAEINARLLGRTVEVLVEGKKKGKWQGRTRGGKLVFFSSDGDLPGQVVNVSIEKTGPWSLQGSIESRNVNLDKEEKWGTVSR